MGIASCRAYHGSAVLPISFGMPHTALVQANIMSIYKDKTGSNLPLPLRLNQFTPDTMRGVGQFRSALRARGGDLLLSDGHRTYDAQHQAHLDYVSHKKQAYSPAPGGSFHEAGRAIDLDLNSLRIPLIDCWHIVIPLGWFPIIKTPDTKLAESWHFEYRGPFQAFVQKYGYRTGAKAAIADIGQQVDEDPGKNAIMQLQWQLLRLNYLDCPDPIDGQRGHSTELAINEALQKHPNIKSDLSPEDLANALNALGNATV